MDDLLDKIFKLNDEILTWRLIDQEVVFLNTKERAFYELNKTATYIWAHLNGKRTLNDIINGLAERFLFKKNIAEKDVVEFIKKGIKDRVFILAK
jgi:hypothetical protein